LIPFSIFISFCNFINLSSLKTPVENCQTLSIQFYISSIGLSVIISSVNVLANLEPKPKKTKLITNKNFAEILIFGLAFTKEEEDRGNELVVHLGQSLRFVKKPFRIC